MTGPTVLLRCGVRWRVGVPKISVLAQKSRRVPWSLIWTPSPRHCPCAPTAWWEPRPDGHRGGPGSGSPRSRRRRADHRAGRRHQLCGPDLGISPLDLGYHVVLEDVHPARRSISTPDALPSELPALRVRGDRRAV